MNKFIALLFTVVTSIQFIDSRDDQNKTYLIITYENNEKSTLQLDKKDLHCKKCIDNAINRILTERKL